jgi:hypothetical protein
MPIWLILAGVGALALWMRARPKIESNGSGPVPTGPGPVPTGPEPIPSPGLRPGDHKVGIGSYDVQLPVGAVSWYATTIMGDDDFELPLVEQRSNFRLRPVFGSESLEGWTVWRLDVWRRGFMIRVQFLNAEEGVISGRMPPPEYVIAEYIFDAT